MVREEKEAPSKPLPTMYYEKLLGVSSCTPNISSASPNIHALSFMPLKN